MDNKKLLNLDYCVIQNPFSEIKEYLVFITSKDKEDLDETLLEKDEYKDACIILGEEGFVQTDIFTFQNSDIVEGTISKLKKKLKINGFKYSKKLESTIKYHSKQIKEENGISNTNLPAITHKSPELGESVELYLYLFVKSTIYGDGVAFDFSGNFSSSKETDSEKYIGIIKSNFIRKKNNDKRVYFFESEKTYKEFIKDVDCLFECEIDFTSQIKKTKNIDEIYIGKYSFIQIMNVMNLENKISIDAPVIHYDKMIEMSKRIEKEKEETKKYLVPIVYLQNKCESLIQVLNAEIKKEADIENYEFAQAYKNAKDFVSEKLLEIDKMTSENITQEEYEEKFLIKNFFS